MDSTGRKLFKKSLIGGFSKEDVSNYIESMSSQQNSKLQEIKDELRRVANENLTLNEKLSAECEKTAQLTAEKEALSETASNNQMLSERIDALVSERDELNAAISAENGELSKIHSELAALKRRSETLAALENEYNTNKSRIAEIELSAIERASEKGREAEQHIHELEAEAQERIAIREKEFSDFRETAVLQVEELFKAISASYISLKSEIDTMDTHFNRMIETAKLGTARVTTSCDRAGNVIEELRRKNAALDKDSQKAEVTESNQFE